MSFSLSGSMDYPYFVSILYVLVAATNSGRCGWLIRSFSFVAFSTIVFSLVELRNEMLLLFSASGERELRESPNLIRSSIESVESSQKEHQRLTAISSDEECRNLDPTGRRYMWMHICQIWELRKKLLTISFFNFNLLLKKGISFHKCFQQTVVVGE